MSYNEDSPKTQIIELRKEVAELKTKNAELEERNRLNVLGYCKDFLSMKSIVEDESLKIKAIVGSVE